jgi:hypothetical protein
MSKVLTGAKIGLYMRLDTFIARLEKNELNAFIYSTANRENMVNVWKHAGTYVLTWEECPPGEQYNESNYTRDERYVFGTIDELLRFLEQSGLSTESFTP